jgi:quercetin dioxygenase-like cupin family protein
MSAVSEERLTGYLLGLLDDAEAAEVEAALAGDPAAVDALDEMAEALSCIAPPVGAGGVERARAALAPRERFVGFEQAVGEIIDRSAEDARTVLTAIDDPGRWEAAPIPNAHFFHLEGGPATEGADVGFVRVDAGTEFPMHEHLGREVVLVLQGAVVDGDGTVFGPGAIDRRDAGTAHRFRAAPGPDLIYLVVVFEGVEFHL